MSGMIFCYGPCYGCGQVFGFNPDLVPSIRIDADTGEVAPTGVRQPVCGMCVARANPARAANGVPPIVVAPGAYEPGREDAL